MMARVAWWAFLLVVAILTWGVQLDRQSQIQPQISSHVPEPLRDVAQMRFAQAAVRNGQPDALEEARELIRRRPIPAESLEVLARAQLAAGQPDRAIATFEAASSRGWRVQSVQLAVAGAAIDAGNYEAAADRLAAVLAVNRAAPDFYPVLNHLLETPDGRSAMADKLAGEGHWQSRFTRQAASAADPADFWLVLAEAARRGAQLACADYNLAAKGLIAQGQTAPSPPGRCRRG